MKFRSRCNGDNIVHLVIEFRAKRTEEKSEEVARDEARMLSRRNYYVNDVKFLRRFFFITSAALNICMQRVVVFHI